jgi:dolichol-phosphate mannosyltransferase
LTFETESSIVLGHISAMARLISVVIPCFNEEQNVPLMYRALRDVINSLEGAYTAEFLFINDGSHDRTWEVIEEVAQSDSRVKGICFSRNFGNQYAFEAGLRAATGDIIITMDGDLQHPPAMIPELIEQYEAGNEIVMTSRVRYGSEPLSKKVTSYLFYRIYNFLADQPIEPASMDFMLLSRRVVDVLNTTNEAERFYRGLVEWVGFRKTRIQVTPNNRENGTSAMTLQRLIALTWTAITSFSTLPMKAIIVIGSLVMTAAWGLLLVMAIAKFGFASTYFSELAFLVVFVIGTNGLSLAAIGIIAMYLLRIHKEVQGRPNFVVEHARPSSAFAPSAPMGTNTVIEDSVEPFSVEIPARAGF